MPSPKFIEAYGMVRLSRSLYQTLNGLFAVYKPPGIHWKRLRDTVETKLLKELNSLEQPVLWQQVRFLPSFTEGENGNETSLTVAQLPVLAGHPQVKGPAFVALKVGAGHRLDLQSSGVLVLGVGNGNQQLAHLYNSHLTKEYTVKGSFGKATEDFSDTGRLIERTTYDHITLDRLERIIAVIQGSHQRALLTYSGIDLKSQEAYELASRGLLRPMHKSPPIITAIRCVHFSPPNFMLEIQCLHETQQYLRKVIHEIGLELKSSAVCTHVRRTRDGIFTVEDALIRTQWELQSIQAAVRASRSKVKAKLQEDSWRHTDIAGEDMFTGVKAQERSNRCSGPTLVGD
ncbi:mitochondrial mRNA pseudouridine synthase TRUB2 isoform X1 [Carcharodon carcharias]|uniref:mitochondrial mRNA pseudouridine synthase TRUB2 isoform X1 n=2 Tax=Carcharodon carcharias TaxID=13397 RepID=UPI001B7DBDB2|nr:mitochondrial mRNA pseudouridine synthase TRUB2 isoform X1 [Carcharodon carcharias]